MEEILQRMVLANFGEKFCPRIGNHLAEEKSVPKFWPIVLCAVVTKSVKPGAIGRNTEKTVDMNRLPAHDWEGQNGVQTPRFLILIVILATVRLPFRNNSSVNKS